MAPSSIPAIAWGLASLALSGLWLGGMNAAKTQGRELECGSMTGRTQVIETQDAILIREFPLFRIRLDLEMEDWPELRSALQEFADTRGWIVRDLSEVRPDVVRILHIDVCADNGLRFSVSEQRWAWRGYASARPGYGLGMPLYGDLPDDVWQRAAADMVHWIETRWPDRVRFSDPGGYIIDRPDFIDTYEQP
jgi:hypothetical protein